MKFYVCFKKKKKKKKKEKEKGEKKKAPPNVCFWGESEEEGGFRNSFKERIMVLGIIGAWRMLSKALVSVCLFS